jgi:hypothetical protein
MIHPNSIVSFAQSPKFEGQRTLLVLANQYVGEGMADDSIGDVSEWPFVHIARVDMGDKYGTIYVRTDEQGFVYETDETEFLELSASIARADDIAEALAVASEELAMLQVENVGPCESCEVLRINGVRSHEIGCPFQAQIVAAQKRVDELEDAL